MQNIIIDREFQELLPPLDKKTYRLLEESILAQGVLTPLAVWDSDGKHILIDGYNRHRICTEHGISFETVVMEFQSREEAVIWIISNQVARRNLSPMQLTYYRGVHYRTSKKIVKNKDGKNRYTNDKNAVIAGDEGQIDSDILVSAQNEQKLKNESAIDSQNEIQPPNPTTAEQLGKHYKVAQATIRRDEQVADAIDAIGEKSPEVKSMILSGELRIDKKDLQMLSSVPKDELQVVAEGILAGTYGKDAATSAAAEAEAETSSPFESVISSIASLDKALGKVSEDITTHLPNIKVKADRARLKKALKTCSDTLNALYKRV